LADAPRAAAGLSTPGDARGRRRGHEDDLHKDQRRGGGDGGGRSVSSIRRGGRRGEQGRRRRRVRSGSHWPSRREPTSADIDEMLVNKK
jgi:hypothetical protein